MISNALRGTALAAVLATATLPALPYSAEAAPWGWGGGWGGGWGRSWGWGGLGVGVAAGLIGSAVATPYYGYGYPYYPAYSYYPSYGYYPGYASYPAYAYYPAYGYGYAGAGYWGSGVYLRMTKGSTGGKHIIRRK